MSQLEGTCNTLWALQNRILFSYAGHKSDDKFETENKKPTASE